MHFAQTRLATIDTYVVFFVMGMYLFMYLYARRWRTRSLRHSLLLLLACGVFMGLAISSKWQGIYGAFGLPVLFFPEWFSLYKTDKRNAYITAACCFGFFIFIPLLIYTLSYIPFAISIGATDLTSGIKAILQNQDTMWSYHSNLVSEHPFSSPWWEWPFNLRPIYYYSHTVSTTVRQGISSFGNPAVWWTGVGAVVYGIWRLIKTREYTLFFLLIAFAAQYLPWVLVPRTTYIYHYFPSVPFIVLFITYMFKQFYQQSNRRVTPLIYASAVVVLFILFYPVLSGMPFSVWYVHNLLRWLPGWVLM
jgi:dolichyl-phosphate-mannose--protein O-mannosyl transferase